MSAGLLQATTQNIKLQTSPKVTEGLNSPPLIIKDDDTQIIRLKKMRHNMALTEAKDNLQKQIKEGKAENADSDHLRYERLGVEIDLEVLRRGMAE